MAATTFRTRRSRSRNTASIGNRMNAVWIDPLFVISIPSPGERPSRPSRPRMRVSGLAATSQRATTTRPSSSTSALVSDKRRRVREQNRGGAAEAEEGAVGEGGARGGTAGEEERRRPHAPCDHADRERGHDLHTEQEAEHPCKLHVAHAEPS